MPKRHLRNNHHVYKLPDQTYNVKLLENNTFSFKNLLITILVVLTISLVFMYLFNFQQLNNAWWSSDFWNVFISAIKDFLYSSLFVSIIIFVIFIVFKRKI